MVKEFKINKIYKFKKDIAFLLEEEGEYLDISRDYFQNGTHIFITDVLFTERTITTSKGALKCSLIKSYDILSDDVELDEDDNPILESWCLCPEHFEEVIDEYDYLRVVNGE